MEPDDGVTESMRALYAKVAASSRRLVPVLADTTTNFGSLASCAGATQVMVPALTSVTVQARPPTVTAFASAVAPKPTPVTTMDVPALPEPGSTENTRGVESYSRREGAAVRAHSTAAQASPVGAWAAAVAAMAAALKEEGLMGEWKAMAAALKEKGGMGEWTVVAAMKEKKGLMAESTATAVVPAVTEAVASSEGLTAAVVEYLAGEWKATAGDTAEGAGVRLAAAASGESC
eukprot:scaffold25307_cov109-Isochrysis_galbana.AAC.12